MEISSKELKKVKQFVIEEIECTLESETSPTIKKASLHNIDRAIKQNYNKHKDWSAVKHLKYLRKIYDIVRKW